MMKHTAPTRGFTLIEFLIGIAMTTVIFIVATNLVISFFKVDTKSKRSQEIEQAKSDITSELTNALAWGSDIAFANGSLKVGTDVYDVTDGIFRKNGTPFSEDVVHASNFSVDMFNDSAEMAAPGTGRGLTGRYFDNSNFTNLKATQTDLEIDFAWLTNGTPNPALAPNDFSIQWVGQLEIPETGQYTFYTRTDDGVRLWIGNELIINNWTHHSSFENSATKQLTGGQSVPIRIEYFQGNNLGEVRLSWSSAKITKQIIPTEFLYPFQSQTSFKVHLDLEHAQSAATRDAIDLFISPRFANSQEFFPVPSATAPVKTAKPSGSPTPTPSPSAKPTPTSTPLR